MDVTMSDIGNVKEWDLDEWKQFFRQADERFIFKSLSQPFGSTLAIIEVKGDM